VVPARRELRVALEAVRRVLDRAGGDPGALEEVHDLVAVALCCPRPDMGVEVVDVLDSPRHGGETGVARPRRATDGPDQCLPVLFGPTRHDHPLVVTPRAGRAPGGG